MPTSPVISPSRSSASRQSRSRHSSDTPRRAPSSARASAVAARSSRSRCRTLVTKVSSRPAPPSEATARLVARRLQPSGVEKGDRYAAQIERLLQHVASGPFDRRDDGALFFEQTVEKTRLADVRRARQGDRRPLTNPPPALVGARQGLDG